jgi:hypothetical protein
MPTAAAITRTMTIPTAAPLLIADLEKVLDIFILKRRGPLNLFKDC